MKTKVRNKSKAPLAAPAVVGFVFALVALSACRGLGKLPTARNAVTASALSTAADGITVFKSTVYALTRQNCASCHGVSQAPQFAVADLNAAYAASELIAVPAANDLPTASFAELVFKVKDADAPGYISRSRLAIKAGDGHCGPSCTNQRDPMIASISKWRTAEKVVTPQPGPSVSASPSPGATAPAGSGKPTLITLEVPMPSPLPSPSGAADPYARVRFDLGKALPANPDLKDAVFEIQVQLFTPTVGANQGAYRFSKPRVGSPTANLYIKGIRVMLDGVWDPSTNDYLATEAIVPADVRMTPAALTTTYRAADIPFPLLSADTMLVLQTTPSANEKISISFEVLNQAAVQPCKNLALWVTNVKPIARATTGIQCAGCHGGSNGGATSAFNMAATTPDDILCMRFRDRSNLAVPASSNIVTYPLGTSGSGHPLVPKFDTVSKSWIDWVTTEK